MPNALQNVNIMNYDYLMYVDASGDDGIQFKNSGTSRLYVVACFTCNPSTIKMNTDILLHIKKLLRCRPEDEIKSPTVCKHKDFSKVLSLLRNLEGYFNCHVTFKEKLSTYGNGTNDLIYWPSKRNGKLFTSFCHAIAISEIPRKLEGKKFFAIIDNMKKIEMDTVNKIKEYIQRDNIDIKYVDSRSSGHNLLQIADILAGVIRYAFEEYISIKGLTLNNRCATCNRKNKLCRNKPASLSTPKMRNLGPIQTFL